MKNESYGQRPKRRSKVVCITISAQCTHSAFPSGKLWNGGFAGDLLSVGTPVFITNKTIYGEGVGEFGAGFVSEDNQQGINNLLSSWNKNEHSSMKISLNCFVNIHIQNSVKKNNIYF